MDIDKLEMTYGNLISYMKKKEYLEYTIQTTEIMIRDIISHKSEIASYPDYFEKFIDSKGVYVRDPKYNHKRTTLRRIWAFEEFDHLPDNLNFRQVIFPSKYDALPKQFQDIVDAYEKYLDTTTLSVTTLYNYRDILERFLTEMNAEGASCVEDITPIMVSGFFVKNGKWVRGNAIANNLLNIFRNLSAEYPHLQRLSQFVCKRKDVVNLHGIIPEDKVREAKAIIFGDDNRFSLRDKTIIAIAIFTGMRGSDIAALTLDDIDWNNDCIHIVQSKTKVFLTLPLLPSVGNIIFDYITKGRPKVMDSRKLFFNELKPSKVLNARNVGAVVGVFFTKLGLDGSKRNRGLNALRHRLASALLSKGTEPAVISSILGHVSPSSLNHYVDMDIENLRECALDISMFPISEEVFK